MTSKINDIIKVIAVCLIALVVVGCGDMEPMEPSFDITNTPEYGVIDKPKKTITIKRKKPTIGNPSPRPLSAEAPIEEYYEGYEE